MVRRAGSLLTLVFCGCLQSSCLGSSGGTPANAPGLEGVRYAGGDGLSCETAVAILGASNSMMGILSEYNWVKQRYPEHKSKSKSRWSVQGT